MIIVINTILNIKRSHTYNSNINIQQILSFKDCLNYFSLLNEEEDMDHIDWSFYIPNKQQLEKYRVGSVTKNFDTFQKIYISNYWGKSSGPGSTLMRTTQTICNLNHILQLFNTTLLIDLSCGDQQWMKYVRMLNPSLKYIGTDVVPSVIHRNTIKYGNEKNEFFLVDSSEDDILFKIKKNSEIWKDADSIMIFSRQAWQHNSIKTVIKIISELRKINTVSNNNNNYIAISNDANIAVNRDISSGGFSRYNYFIHPFNLPEPLLTFKDCPKNCNFHQLTIWNAQQF